jgi:tetratricopeptide (TPR) repeat protein
MQATISSKEEIAGQYRIASQALYEVARAYFTLGNLEQSKGLLWEALRFLEGSELAPPDYLKLLLLYGQVLVVDQFLGNTTSDLAFSTILKAKQLAKTNQDQAGLGDALSLLGQAHYFTSILDAMNSGVSIDGAQGDGKFDEAQDYQQQALSLRQALGDTRGISESHFLIGNVYQRWQQAELAKQHFITAIQIAEDNHHLYEKSEPSRHLALLALNEGEVDEALSYALQALACREQARFKPYLPLDHILLSNIYLKKVDTLNGLLQAEQAYSLAEELGFNRIRALSLITLGEAQLALKEEAAARTSFERARSLAEEVHAALYVTRARQWLQSLSQIIALEPPRFQALRMSKGQSVGN